MYSHRSLKRPQNPRNPSPDLTNNQTLTSMCNWQSCCCSCCLATMMSIGSLLAVFGITGIIAVQFAKSTQMNYYYNPPIQETDDFVENLKKLVTGISSAAIVIGSAMFIFAVIAYYRWAKRNRQWRSHSYEMALKFLATLIITVGLLCLLFAQLSLFGNDSDPKAKTELKNIMTGVSAAVLVIGLIIFGISIRIKCKREIREEVRAGTARNI